MLAQETVLEKLREWMEELFEIAPEDVQLESNLASDLDVDSIDAIDLVVELKKYVGKKISPEDFKSVRTVEDIVNAVADLMAKEA